MKKPSFDEHTLELLEFEKVRALLAAYASSSVGKRRCQAIGPIGDLDEIKRALALTGEMVEALNSRLQPPTDGLRDLTKPLKQARFGMLLEIEQVRDVRDVLALSGKVRDFWLRLEGNYPALERLLSDVEDFRPLAAQIDTVIDERGEVRDDASPELRRIRGEIKRHEDRIQEVIRKLLKDDEVRKALRYASPTVHAGHHVLPVAVNFRHRVKGVVHRTSTSGETLYVEPSKVAEISADMALVRAAEQREIRRLLRQLTTFIAAEADRIGPVYAILIRVDFLAAKARMAIDHDMRAPEVAADGPLRLRQARHPLLQHIFREQHRQAVKDGDKDHEAQDVVPIDFHLGGAFDLLIITGPNTGGKTVTLKTVGLCCVMALSGLPIPVAAGSRVSLLDDVLADIGDEQSLEQSLSTFSAHVARIGAILGQCGPKTLVLLDELGAGTDPTEGAALGRSILDELSGSGTRAIVTTHLGDLKTYALNNERAENGAVEFDVQTLRPTYRLVIGQFGESCALKIASRLKLPRELVDRAFRYMKEDQGPGRRQVRKLQRMREQTEKERQELIAAQELAAEQASEYERKSALLQRERDVSEKLERARTALRKGDQVHVSRFEKVGTIQRIDHYKKQVVVSVGNMQWDLPLDEVVPA